MPLILKTLGRGKHSLNMDRDPYEYPRSSDLR
jgi:hypothetical protein